MAYDPRWDDRDDPFTVGARGRDGVGRGAFRAARFRTPTRGVRVRVDAPDDLIGQVRALSLVAPEGTAAFGLTAARLHRLPLPAWATRDPQPVHLTARVRARPPKPDGRSYGSGAAKMQRPQARWHRVELRDDDYLVHDGVLVTTPARTFVDLAAILRLPDLVAVADAVVRDGQATRDELRAMVRRHRGRRGVRVARRALELLDPRSESPQESRLRVVLIESGLPVPIPQLVVRAPAGGFIARVDLGYPRWRIAVEYDGAYHADPRQRERDASRRTLLREHGWYVVEVTARDLRDPYLATAKVRGALRSRGALR
ncbi:MAG: hypothetical protein R2737_18180 [Candidatus Nanopelagicales bacterium]